MRVRRFEQEDLHWLLEIQGRCGTATQWTRNDYLRLLAEPTGLIVVADLETMTPPKLLGFVACRRIMDEAEIVNLAVDPDHQPQGVASALVAEARRRLTEEGARRVFLEVRSSNQPALTLYYSQGFRLSAIRKQYYRSPTEDGLVLEAQLP